MTAAVEETGLGQAAGKAATLVRDSVKTVIAASMVGTAIEFYDFYAYGTAAANYFPHIFFSAKDNPTVALLMSLLTFAIAFIARPLGSLIFGHFGDRLGRKRMLMLTVWMMGIATALIGILPSFASIGWWAPVLLVTLRAIQGFAVGGEWGGAALLSVESAPKNKKAFYSSGVQVGYGVGLLLSTGLVSLISQLTTDEQFLSWGWRIPFFLALPLGIIGLYLRHALEETPAFQQHVDKMEQGDREGLQDGPKVSFKEIATKHWRSLLTCIGLVISTNVTYYMLLTYMPSYLSHNLHYSEDHGVLIIIAIMVGMLFVQPVIGMLSDRFGRRPFILIGSVALFGLSIPAFIMINSNVLGLIFAGLLLLAVVLNCFIGVMASSLPAMFPTHIRFSALASAFNISVLIAGLTPTLAAWLVESTQNLMMPAYYLMVVALIGLITGLSMKETANRPLKGATPAASDIQEAKEILGEHYDNIEHKIEDIDQEIADLQEKRSRLVQQHPRIND